MPGTKADFSSRTSVVTQNFLEEFKQMITDTTTDLSQHIEEIDAKLTASRDFGASNEPSGEVTRIYEERESAQYCLHLCTQIYKHLDQALPAAPADIDPSQVLCPESIHNPTSLTTTKESITMCKNTMANTTSWLEKHLRNLDVQLRFLPKSGSNTVERENLQQEMESAKQCLQICSQASTLSEIARSNVFEDVSMTDDGYQVIVSTVGDLVSAKRITAGARSLQVMGQMSDESLQNISTRHGMAGKQQSSANGTSSKFEDRHGMGVKLK